MDKQTLSNYGWVVVLVLILAVLLALATPFGSFVSTAVKNVTGGLWDLNSASLNAVGLDTGDIGFDGDPASCGIEGHYIGDDKGEHGIPVEDCKSGHTYTCECEGWVVPDGGKYYVGVTSTTLGDYTGATKVYNAGEKLPCGYVPVYGDVFTDKDYEYRYNSYYSGSIWSMGTYLKGWGVRVLNTDKISYREILENINNKPIKDITNTFKGCTSLTTAPTIPNSVTSITQTFMGCSALTTPPDLSKISNVADMSSTFQNCTSLKTAPAIPSKVTNMFCTFAGCTSLTTAPVIPNSVTNMSSTFSDCENLKTYVGNKDVNGDFSNYKIPNGLTNMSSTFNHCKSLTTAPLIPNSVTNMSSTFSDCTSLTTAPVIPNSVTNMYMTFNHCKSLTTAPLIPNNVTKMSWIFANCSSLTGVIEINANPTSYSNCFTGIYFSLQKIKITGNSTMLDTLGATGKYYCATCNGTCQYNH